jgi:hypothetical protein
MIELAAQRSKSAKAHKKIHYRSKRKNRNR